MRRQNNISKIIKANEEQIIVHSRYSMHSIKLQSD